MCIKKGPFPPPQMFYKQKHLETLPWSKPATPPAQELGKGFWGSRQWQNKIWGSPEESGTGEALSSVGRCPLTHLKPVSECWVQVPALLPILLRANAHAGRQQVMAQALGGSCQPGQSSRLVALDGTNLGSGRHLGTELADRMPWSLSLSLSLCLLNKKWKLPWKENPNVDKDRVSEDWKAQPPYWTFPGVNSEALVNVGSFLVLAVPPPQSRQLITQLFQFFPAVENLFLA